MERERKSEQQIPFGDDNQKGKSEQQIPSA
jgi:hypothetical protein